MNPLNIYSASILPYMEALEIQEKLLHSIQEGGDDAFVLLEHPKVITMGINANTDNILYSEEKLIAEGYDVQKIRRGGDVTYHGPGQLVGYTLVNLKKNHGGSIKKFVYNLEQLFIDFLAQEYAIVASRDPLNAGVFVGNDKIVAIGLSVHKGVTMHGFAFNVNTHLDDFKAIVPCGLKDRGVTSLEFLRGKTHDMTFIKNQIFSHFALNNNYFIKDRLSL